MAKYWRHYTDVQGEQQVIVVDATRVQSRCMMDVSLQQSFGWKTEKEQADVGEWYCNDGIARYLMPACVFTALYHPHTEGIAAH